jgi:hypothetical protein
MHQIVGAVDHLEQINDINEVTSLVSTGSG